MEEEEEEVEDKEVEENLGCVKEDADEEEDAGRVTVSSNIPFSSPAFRRAARASARACRSLVSARRLSSATSRTASPIKCDERAVRAGVDISCTDTFIFFSKHTLLLPFFSRMKKKIS